MTEINERIKSIAPFEGRKAPEPGDWDHIDGFEIVTNKQTIELGISNGQSCCEDWGFFITEDDTAKFEGANLRSIEVTDTNRANKPIPPDETDFDGNPAQPGSVSVYDGDVMFVDINTSRGTLQFVAYNAHNGYYGHSAYIKSTQIVHEETL